MEKDLLYSKSIKLIKKILKEKLPEGSRYFLFGSRAYRNNLKFSHIDIGIISDKPIDKIIFLTSVRNSLLIDKKISNEFKKKG